MKWAEERIDSYVDGSLSRVDRRKFDRACRADPALQEAVSGALRVRNALRKMGAPPCPPSVTEAIFARVREDPRRFSLLRELQGFGASLWRPALLMVAGVVLCFVLVQEWSAPPPQQYAAAEVDEALAEVKWTLAYLNGVGSRTGETIREEVFAEGVVRPIERGLGFPDHSVVKR